MKQIGPLAWLAIMLGIATALLLGIPYFFPTNTGSGGKILTRKEEKQQQRQLTVLHQQVHEDTTSSQQLLTQAAQAKPRIAVLHQKAVAAHKKSLSHATPVPTTTAALDSLQRLFATYGDQPRRAAAPDLR